MLQNGPLDHWLRSFLADFRFSLRQLRKSPGFALTAIITLALGIGSATAIFSVLDGALINPYPYKDAERLATFSVFANDQFRAWRFPAAAFVDFQQQNHTFEDMFGVVYQGVQLAQREGTEEIFGGAVTPNMFDSLGMPPLMGRPLNVGDAKPGAPPVFVISYRLWTKLFHRNPNVLGTTFTINSTPMTLVGIMPRRFLIGNLDLWTPLSISKSSFLPGAGLESNEIWTVGHLKRGVSPETAAADIQSIATPFQEIDPIYFPRQFKIVAYTLNSDSVGRDFKFGLFTLMAAVALLLLIACSNVANLLLARATTREMEFGIRCALGASRLRVIRQLFVESFSLAMASCILGCLLAYIGLNAIIALIPPDTIPPEAVITIRPGVLIFCLCMAIVTTVICGLAPSIYAVRGQTQVALSGAGKGTSSGTRHGGLRNSFVIAEVAFAIVLSVCSGLVLRTLWALQSVQLGFDPARVVYTKISWPEKKYDTAVQQHLLIRKILDHIQQVPGVQAVTETSAYPPHTHGRTTAIISGKTPPQNRNTAFLTCTEGYFQTLDRHLLQGAVFTKNDIDSARHVVVVNRTFVREQFGAENPIGHKMRFSDFETLADWPRDPYFEIIGVVDDAKNSGLQDVPRPEVYLPATISGAGPHNLMVRTNLQPSVILREIRSEFSALDPNVGIGESGTVATLLERYYFARPTFLFITLCIFAVIALLLVGAGVFSLVSYTVAMQTHEIGIRMALGARSSQILNLVIKSGMRLILTGVAIGLFASYFLTRLLSSQIWGVSVTDPFTFGVVASLAVVVGILACVVPAHRASRVDPLVALRYE